MLCKLKMPWKELSLSVNCSWHNLMPSLSLEDLSELSMLPTLEFISWDVDADALKFSSSISICLLLICCGERTTLVRPEAQARECFFIRKAALWVHLRLGMSILEPAPRSLLNLLWMLRLEYPRASPKSVTWSMFSFSTFICSPEIPGE